jgi:5-methylcytosine-specific restriction protein A
MYRRSKEAVEYRALYNTALWQQLRKHQLAKQSFCEYCLTKGKHRPATIADHKRPHRGDPVLFFDANNLQSLCKSCHDSDKQGEEYNGYRKGFDDTGAPLDPRHPWYEKDEPASGPPI